MGSLIKRLSFSATIFVVSHYIFAKLVKFIVWFLDEDQTVHYINNQDAFEFLYGTAIPYFLATWVTYKYIRRVFYIPTAGEAIRWVLSFIFFSWGWLIIEFLWDLY